jgi:hypothetical protein
MPFLYNGMDSKDWSWKNKEEGKEDQAETALEWQVRIFSVTIFSLLSLRSFCPMSLCNVTTISPLRLDTLWPLQLRRRRNLEAYPQLGHVPE